MSEVKHIIEPERHGLWIAAAFIIGLLALVISFINIHRVNDMMAATQLEILALNQKIEAYHSTAPQASPVAPTAPSAASAESTQKK